MLVRAASARANLVEWPVSPIYDARLDVPDRVEVEQVSSMINSVEHIGSRLVDRRGPCVDGWVGYGSVPAWIVEVARR